MLVLFHLIGDIHQPLHVGFASDKGGNDVLVTFKGQKTNLHSLWDTRLIEDLRINLTTLETGYKDFSAESIAAAKKTTVEDWLNSSRRYVPFLYNFSDPALGDAYVNANKEVIISQLINAGNS